MRSVNLSHPNPAQLLRGAVFVCAVILLIQSPQLLPAQTAIRAISGQPMIRLSTGRVARPQSVESPGAAQAVAGQSGAPPNQQQSTEPEDSPLVSKLLQTPFQRTTAQILSDWSQPPTGEGPTTQFVPISGKVLNRFNDFVVVGCESQTLKPGTQVVLVIENMQDQADADALDDKQEPSGSEDRPDNAEGTTASAEKPADDEKPADEKPADENPPTKSRPPPITPNRIEAIPKLLHRMLANPILIPRTFHPTATSRTPAQPTIVSRTVSEPRSCRQKLARFR